MTCPDVANYCSDVPNVAKKSERVNRIRGKEL